MPTTSALDSRVGPERLRSRIARLRTRALFARFLRLAGSSLASSWAAALAWVGVDGSSVTLGLAGGAFGAGLFLALVLTWWRRPSLGALAKEIDRKAGLEQRLETSLELLGDDDPTSRLILEDTLGRTAELHGEDVFPLRVAPGPRTTTAALVLLAGTLFLVLSGSETPRTATGLVTLRDVDAPGPELPTVVPEPSAPGASGASGEDVPREAGVAELPPPAAAEESPRESLSAREWEPSLRAESEIPPPRVATSEDTSPSVPSPSFQRIDPFETVEHPAGAARSMDGDGENGVSGRGRLGGATAPGLAFADTTGEAGSATGASSSGGAGTGSSSDADAANDPQIETGPARYESPLPRDGVPSALTDYVRAYFERIRSPR